jgi:assimilatory nitrate reductase catalytic subunit
MCVPFGRGEGRDGHRVGVWLRAASTEAPPAGWLRELEALLGLDAPHALRYADPRHAQHRCARVVREAESARLDAFLLAGDTRASAWMSELLVERLPADAYGRALLAGSAAAPLRLPARGAQVCTCFDVTEPQIDSVLARCRGTPDAQLAQLQGELKCGTNCGSCLPALRRKVAQQMEAA